MFRYCFSAVRNHPKSKEKRTVIHSLMCFVLFSLVLPLAVTRCHLLSFVVSRCHLLSFFVPLIVICYHSLLFAVTRCTTRYLSLDVTRCHSMYHSSAFLKKIDSINKIFNNVFLKNRCT